MMSKGIIKWFNNEKGYGFINGSADEDIFVHYTSIKQDGYKALSEGQVVEFNLIKRKNKYKGKSFSFLLFYKCDKLVIVKEEYYV